MKYNTLSAVGWLITLTAICLIGCEVEPFYDPSANFEVVVMENNTVEVGGVGEYKGFIANNSSRVLKIVCPYDEDISWKLKPQELIKLCLESKEYTFKAYYRHVFTYQHPYPEGIFEEPNSITFCLNTTKNDTIVNPSFVCIQGNPYKGEGKDRAKFQISYSFDRNFRDSVVKEENKAITREVIGGTIFWYPLTGKIYLLYERQAHLLPRSSDELDERTTNFKMMGTVKEEIYDWGVIFWDDKVECRP